MELQDENWNKILDEFEEYKIPINKRIEAAKNYYLKNIEPSFPADIDPVIKEKTKAKFYNTLMVKPDSVMKESLKGAWNDFVKGVHGVPEAAVGTGEAVIKTVNSLFNFPSAFIKEYTEVLKGTPQDEAAAKAQEFVRPTTYEPITEKGKEYAPQMERAAFLPIEAINKIVAKPLRQAVVESPIGKGIRTPSGYPIAYGIKDFGGDPEILGKVVEDATTLIGGGKLAHAVSPGEGVVKGIVKDILKTTDVKPFLMEAAEKTKTLADTKRAEAGIKADTSIDKLGEMRQTPYKPPYVVRPGYRELTAGEDISPEAKFEVDESTGKVYTNEPIKVKEVTEVDSTEGIRPTSFVDRLRDKVSGTDIERVRRLEDIDETFWNADDRIFYKDMERIAEEAPVAETKPFIGARPEPIELTTERSIKTRTVPETTEGVLEKGELPNEEVQAKTEGEVVPDLAKPSEPAMPESYQKEADRLGIVFNGLQERLNKPPMPLFTDLQTKSTFSLPEGKLLEEALKEQREKFAETIPASEAAKVAPVEPPERTPVDIIKDVNTALGKRGELGNKEVVGEQKEARERLNQDLERLRSEASKAGVKIEDYLKQQGFSAEDVKSVLAVRPVFYSQLEEVVNKKMQGRMYPEQLKKMLKNNGVTDAEINNILGEFKEGNAVSKDKVLEAVRVNGYEFEDVVLGEKKKRNEVIYEEDYDELYKSYKDVGQPDDLAHKFATEGAEIREKNRILPTQFSSYQEPGSIPGSYRERFVTVSNILTNKEKIQLSDFDSRVRKPGGRSNLSIEERKVYEKLQDKNQFGWNDGHSAYSDIQNPIVRIRYNVREVDGKKILFVEEMQGPAGDTKYKLSDPNMSVPLDNQGKPDWLNLYAGKSEQIFDTKKTAEEYAVKNNINPKQIEKVIEGEQGKMPPELQSRIYDIGVKKVLVLAKEMGADGVAWTTGEMQADRYDLSKHINKVTWQHGEKASSIIKDWNKSHPSTQIWELLSDKEKSRVLRDREAHEVSITDKDRNTINFYVDNSGKVIDSPRYANIEGKSLSEVIGKDIAKSIMEKESGNLFGLDLKVGGEGLKYLYDVQLPSLFKKYGKEGVDKLDIPSGKADKQPASGNVIGRELGIPEEKISSWWADLEHEQRSKLIEDYYAKANKEVTSVLYTPITPRTPSSFTLYSDPFGAQAAFEGIKKTYGSLKDKWDAADETVVGKTWRGLKQAVMEQEDILGKSPIGKWMFGKLSDADAEGNAFLHKNLVKYIEATKGIKKDSESATRIGKALNGDIPATELPKQEKRAYDFFKENYEFLINFAAKRLAGSDEAYNKVVAEVGKDHPTRMKISELDEATRNEYNALTEEANKLRGKRKVSELSAEEAEQYQNIMDSKRDMLHDVFKKSLTEGEAAAYDLLTKKINNYLPHLFDPKDLLPMFEKELAELNVKLSKVTNKGLTTRYKNRINVLESALNKMKGGRMITFRELPKEIFFKFFKERKGREGYSYDALKAYESYLYGIAKKIYDEPAIKEYGKLYEQLEPELKPYAQDVANHFLGKDKHILDRAASYITNFEWIRALGLNPRSALVNYTQRINTLSKYGIKNSVEAEKMMLFDKERAKALFEESGIAREIPQVLRETSKQDIAGTAEQVASYLFSKVEYGNRQHAYLTGYLDALKKGLTEVEAKKAGLEAVHETQFRYGRLGMPKMFWSPAGRVAFQFTSYPLKQARFITRLYKEDPISLLKYIAYTEGGNLVTQELLDTDLSNALGIGINWGEAIRVAISLAEGDTKGAYRHLKQAHSKGGGILPSGFGPAFMAPFRIAFADEKLKKLKQEVTPIMYTRIKQAYEAIKDRTGNVYPTKNEDGEVVYKLTGRQLLQRTIGPKTAHEQKVQEDREAKANLAKEKKEVIDEISDAMIEGDAKKIDKLIDKYRIIPSPDSLGRRILEKDYTKEELRKPGKAEVYEMMREGRTY
jgi:SOS response regulatory protein OraA/RecX